MSFKNILIISDIEGSSDCWSYRDSAFMTRGWRRACMGMTADAAAVVAGLFDAGVEQITLVDFHRTGYNLLSERIDPRAQIVSGYRRGPVPGIGDRHNAEAVLYLGLHAAAGTDGFLAHTFTSRLARLEVNGAPMPEVAFFSASMAPYGIRPIFFSGCPIACAQAQAIIPQIYVYPIDKTDGPNRFDVESWRSGLAKAAAEALNNHAVQPYLPPGPFHAKVTMRDGPEIARKLAQRWGFRCEKDLIYIETADIHTLYQSFIRLCYLTPQIEKTILIGLFLYNLMGRIGLTWVRRGLKIND